MIGSNNGGATSECLTSPDGITWTQRSMPTGTYWYSLEWNGSVFCAVTNTSTTSATSPDGVTWTSHTLPATNLNTINVDIRGMFYLRSSIASPNIYTSRDGVNWTLRTLPLSAQWYGVGFDSNNNGIIFAYNTTSAVSIIEQFGVITLQADQKSLMRLV
jgi:hypothetical protein